MGEEKKTKKERVYSSLIIHNYRRGYTQRRGSCATLPTTPEKKKKRRKGKNNKEPTQPKGKTTPRSPQVPPDRNPAQVGESWLLQRGSRMQRRGKKPGKREKIRKTNYKIVNHMPAFPRSGEGRGAPSLGTFEGWGGVQAWRSSQAGGKAPLPVPASFGIRQNDPCVGKRQRDTGRCPLRFSFHGKPRGKKEE